MASSGILRQLEMLKMIPEPPNSIATKDLYQQLLDAGYKTTDRTVQRDLHNISELMGLSCETQGSANLWSYAIKKAEWLPSMSSDEALLLVIAEKLLKISLPTASTSMLEPRLNKAKATLKNAKSQSTWQEKLQVLPSELPLHPEPLDLTCIKPIYDSLLLDQQVIISYKKSVINSAEKQYQLNPLGLIVRDYKQYLIASKHQSPELPQLFLLNKVTSAKRNYSPVVSPTNFVLKKYQQENHSGYLLDNESKKIKLQVTGSVINLLSHNKIDPDQQITQLDETWMEITATSYLTYDLVGWIMRYGSLIKVIAPQELVDAVISRAGELMDLYG